MRNLEREIGTVCRKVAREVAEGKAKRKVTISAKRARELLGRRRFFAEQRRRTSHPGVATGLAWTPTGGEVLFVEATAMPGDGKLTITGQLGDVMRESAQAALSWVRGHQEELAPDLAEDWFAEPRHSCPCPGRGGPEGWSVGRGGDGDRALVPHHASRSGPTSR